jgi:diacylglycerol kinase family enzyme
VIGATIDALRARGFVVDVVEQPATGSGLREAARRAVDDEAELIVAIGGDGTIREVAGVLVGGSVPLAIVPAGTANLLAAGLGISATLPAALRALATAVERRIDVGRVRFEPVVRQPAAPGDDGRNGSAPGTFLVAAGTGFDARMLLFASRERKERHGIGAYLLASLRAARDLRARPTSIVIDGRRIETRSVVVLAANAGVLVPRLLRPRLPLDATDGELDVFVVTRGGPVRSVVGALELLAGASVGRTRTGAGLRLRGRSIRVETDPAQPVEVDGDPLGDGAFEAEAVPASLSVLIPAGM